MAAVSGPAVTVLAAGTTTITATQAGNGDFKAAAPIAQPLVVSAGPVHGAPAAPTWALGLLTFAMGAVGAWRLGARRRA